MVFGSNPAGLFGWGSDEKDLMYTQDTSLARRFVQQCRRRMRAQKAALKEVANSKLRRLLG